MKKKHREAMLYYGLKTEAHEELLRRHEICLDAHGTRLAAHDEEIEALQEGANEAGQDVLQRVRCLEQIQDVHQQQVSALEKVKDALYETSNAQALAIDVMQQQIKEINSRLTALTNKYLELRPPKKQPATNPEKEYKRIMKHGASVG